MINPKHEALFEVCHFKPQLAFLPSFLPNCTTKTGEALKQCLCEGGTCTDLIYFFHPNHIGSSTFLTDYNGQPYEFILYLPFGELLTDQKVGPYETPYKFTGKEEDPETGLIYFGARYYDAALGIWLGVDPMGDSPENIKYHPYAYVWNNPLNAIDPDGRSGEWVPDEAGNLVAEKDDNVKSLAKNFGYTIEQAQKFINDSGVKLDNKGNVKEGQKVNVENRFTSIILNEQYDSKLNLYQTKGVDQNCHGITCNDGGYLYEGGMDYHLTNSYKDAKGVLKPLETVVRWGGYNKYTGTNNKNINNHTATIYGFSKDGTMYLATVNGAGAKLEFLKFNDVKNAFKESKIQGIGIFQSGYYNLK